MDDLSPAAQAIDDAAHQAWVTRDDPRSIAAAALRAAADQVAPVDRGSRRQMNIRRDLFAIATELEAQ